MIIPVLMYHSVEPESPDYLTVSAGTFEEHMRFLKDNFTVISGAQGADMHKGLIPVPEHPVIVTFDDGFLPVAQYAVPVLQRLGLTATMFIVGQYIGGDNAWDHKAYRIVPHMSGQQIRECREAGFEIGSHTLTHQRITKLSPEGQKQELDANDRILQEITGEKPRIFAYPYGGADAFSAGLCRERYDVSFATVHCGVFDWTEDPGMVRRIYVSPEDTPHTLMQKIQAYLSGVQHE